MKKAILFLVLAVAASFVFSQDERFNHTVIQEDGSETSFTEIANNGNNKVVLFWASHCGACKMELKAMQDVIGAWQDDYQTELVMISVDRPNARERASKLVEQNGWGQYTTVFDKTNLLYSGFKSYGLPLTLTVNGQGEVTGSWKGYMPSMMNEIGTKLKKMNKKKKKNS